MRFLYVSKVHSIGEAEIRGERLFDESEPMRIFDPSRQRYIVAPGVISEAIGQLASWAVIEKSQFAGRPVFMFADRIDFHSEVPVGTRVDLRSWIEQSDGQSMVFSGEASIGGEVVSRITQCHCHMIPLSDMEDPEFTKLRLKNLRGAGEYYGGAPAFLAKDVIRSTAYEEGLCKVTGKARFSADAFFYHDHFPRFPVTPVVMVNEVIGEVTKGFFPGQNGVLAPKVVENLKIRSFVKPDEDFEVRVELKGKEAREDGVISLATGVSVGKLGKTILRGHYSYEWRGT